LTNRDSRQNVRQQIGSIMIVPLHTSSDCLPEWGMLELNGELILPSLDQEDFPDQRNLELGLLSLQDAKTPTMIIGGHELKGKVIKLDKPFAILKKRKSDKGETFYEVMGLITTKLLFDQYPRTIMR
jgi:chromosome transmission fidelity protein 8